MTPRTPTTTSWWSAPGSAGRSAALRLAEKGYRVARARGRPPVRRRRVRRAPRGTCGASSGRRGWAASASSASTGCPTSRCSPAPASAAARWSTPTRSTAPDEAFYDDPQWRDITDWRAELAPHYDLASRMLGVVQNPTITPSDEAMRDGRRPDGRRAHVPPHAGRGVLRRRAGRGPCRTRTSAAPARTRTGCIAVRRVHDRLPARRQEHPGEELPVAGRAAGVRGRPLTTVTRAAARAGRAGRSRRSAPAPGSPRRTRDTVTADAGGARRRHLRHPAAAAPDARHRRGCRTCRRGSAS